MERLFRTVGQEIYASGSHRGYTVPWKTIAPICKKWAGNRDCDAARIEEMARFRDGGGYMPLVFHLAELPEGLVCYDGNHRREVLTRSAGDPTCVVDVMFGATSVDVLAAFENINKSIQVPALYVDRAMPRPVKEEIVALAARYVITYPAFASTSPHCKCPNFNRDVFIEDITAIYEDFNGSVSVAEISELLRDLNSARAEERFCKPHAKYAASAIKKCREHNFWLFLEHHPTPGIVRELRAGRQLRAPPLPSQSFENCRAQPVVTQPLPVSPASTIDSPLAIT